MADSVVSFLLEHLSQLLAHEANLLCGVEDRIRSLRNELEIINVYLKKSEGKKSKREIEQKVVSQIRDVAHEAEDIIDTFISNVAIHNRRSTLGRMLHGVEHTKLRRNVAEKIDKFKTILNEIHENKSKYDFPENSGGDHSTSAREEEERALSLHMLRRNVEEEDVVGFVHESKEVINRLMEGGSQRNVVSIIGMGGLGKTTLSRKVYNSSEMKKHFNCRAWVYVSNECRARELLLGLLKHFPGYECRRRTKKGKKQKEATNKNGDFSSLSDQDELKKMVRECLESKRYLLVLDDLRKKHDWDEIKDAFPDDNRGSRILITSRLKEVASHTTRDPPYCLQFLTEEQSWELISRKVFRGEEYPSNLEPLGKQMVKSCGGLPLSIVVLAGLLANKEKSHREWSKVVGHVNWYLTSDETQVKDIVLKLSYDNLPTRLKPCFLYVGVFPEDSEIHVKQLLERWVAEGFIQETGSRDPDDVAEDYLYELIDRSLIQVARVKDSGGAKTCCIHDLLRDLCISESKEDKFFHVCTDNNILIPTKPRRLSIHCSLVHYVSSSTNDHSCVRSLFFFDPRCFVDINEWIWLSKGFKLIRVLALEDKCCVKIPSTLGNFIHLRYLRITIRSIPDSICNLQNLQMLDMRSDKFMVTSIISFPYGIWKLKHLRHVYTHGPIELRGHHSKIDAEVMWNLQTISSIVLINEGTTSLIEKGRVPKLRNLGLYISIDYSSIVPRRLLRLQQLRHLNKLNIIFPKMDRASNLINIGCKPEEVLQSLGHLSHLSVLKIDNAMDLVTCATSFPPNITKLTLSGGFPQLQVFPMREFPIADWKLANSAMPCLQSLVIDRCYKLNGLPTELVSLAALRKVHIKGPSGAMDLVLRYLGLKKGCELIVE